MGREKIGVAVAGELIDELEGLVDESADLGASRSEIVEAILTAYLRSDVDHAARVRELIIRRRGGKSLAGCKPCAPGARSSLSVIDVSSTRGTTGYDLLG